MILTILLVIALVILGFVGFIAARPEDFSITRSATLPAPASAIFPHVNDFRLWRDWSPWAKMDPNVKNTFTCPATGEGAAFSWDGNDKVGAGAMTIVESRPDELIRIKLRFLRPFQATHDVRFTFTPAGEQTVVTWTMSGKNSFMAKAITLFMNCDKMIGTQYEKGLASLGSVVESEVTAKC
jgi:hypothetical protein